MITRSRQPSSPRAMSPPSRTTPPHGPPLRVANLTEDGRYAGPQRRIALVAEALSKEHGIETLVIYPRHESERLTRELNHHGVRGRPFGLHRLSRYRRDMVKAFVLFPWEIARLYLLFRREKFDVVHCNGSWQWKGAIASKLAGIPVILHLNDTSAPFFVKRIFRIISKWCVSAFIVAGDRVRFYYLTPEICTNKPVYTIQAPVLCWKIFTRTKAVPSEILNVTGMRVVTLANVNPLKDIETLVKTANLLIAEEPSLTIDFFVYGGLFRSQQEYSDRLRKLMKELGVFNVHFPGATDRVEAVLAAADIYLCTSRSEASPMAIWEAAAAGLPVVSTDVGDVCKFNSFWNFAVTTRVGDVKALASALVALSRSPAKRKTLGGNGQKLARSVFDISICAAEHAEAYQAVTSLTRIQKPEKYA